MHAWKMFICQYPFFSMLVFIGIGFLLRGLVRINRNTVGEVVQGLELAIDEQDFEAAKQKLAQLKTGLLL